MFNVWRENILKFLSWGLADHQGFLLSTNQQQRLSNNATFIGMAKTVEMVNVMEEKKHASFKKNP